MTLLLHKEIDGLKRRILELGAVVEEHLRKAVRSLQDRNGVLAREVMEADEKVDQLEVDLEEEGLKIIALHQPVAVDMRFIVAVLRINSDLERIGDLAVNLAERALYLAGRPEVALPLDIGPMAEKAQGMLKASLDALVNMDVELARRILDQDEEVDAMNREAYTVIYAHLKANPELAEPLLHMLSSTRHLERVADHATNIAEDVIYMVEGNIIRHQPEHYPH